MNVIQWINETFVPMGLKPIEDLPKAVPGEGNFCVIAKVLRTNPNWPKAFVSSSHINLELDYGCGNVSPEAVKELIQAAYISLPPEIVIFLNQFDKGEYPELMDIQAIHENLSDDTYKNEIIHSYDVWQTKQE